MIVCTAVTARDQRELVIRESWLCIIKGLGFSHYFIFIPLTDKRNSQIYKVKQFENLAALKLGMGTETRYLIGLGAKL